MESPPLPANYWTDDFKTVDLLMLHRDVLRRAFATLKKHLPKEGQCSDPMIIDLVKKYVDLLHRLGRLDQLQLERKTLTDCRQLLDKVGLPSVPTLPLENVFNEQFVQYLVYEMIFISDMEKHGLKKKKKIPSPKKLYSPTRK